MNTHYQKLLALGQGAIGATMLNTVNLIPLEDWEQVSKIAGNIIILIATLLAMFRKPKQPRVNPDAITEMAGAIRDQKEMIEDLQKQLKR